jgi:hypothetical protein
LRAARPGVLTACAPLAAPRASRGGGRASRPNLGRARGPARLIGQDPRIISRLAKGQSFVRLIEWESSDAIAKGWGTVIWSSCRVLGWSSRWRGDSRGPDGVWKTQKGQINRSRPGPRSLQWSQAGTAGLREYQPHNQGKARRGNRDSEGSGKQRPRPGSCDRKSIGRGETGRSKTRTGFGHPGPPPARYGLVWNPLRVSSLLFKLSRCHSGCHLIIFQSSCVHPR